jgi:hypothetical protein
VLGAGGLVDGQGVAAEGLGLEINVGDFGFACPPSVAEHDSAIRSEALIAIDRECVLLIAGEEVACSCEKVRHRVAIILTLYCRM